MHNSCNPILYSSKVVCHVHEGIGSEGYKARGHITCYCKFTKQSAILLWKHQKLIVAPECTNGNNWQPFGDVGEGSWHLPSYLINLWSTFQCGFFSLTSWPRCGCCQARVYCYHSIAHCYSERSGLEPLWQLHCEIQVVSHRGHRRAGQ